MKVKFSDLLNDFLTARDIWHDAVWHPKSYDDKKTDSIQNHYLASKAKLDARIAELDVSVHSHLDD